MTRIVVVGSINMDMVTMAKRFPVPGETLMAESFQTIPGGKGANQAVAASRLGAEVSLIGALGDDAFGQQLRDGLAAEGINLEHVRTIRNCASGTASITVAQADNHILVAPAANSCVTSDQVDRAKALIERADVVLVQMEIPLGTVEATLQLGHRLGVPVILNPAPAQPLPLDWLKLVRYVTPNQHEMATLLGADPKEDLQALMQRVPCPFVLTCGGDGAWYREDGEPAYQPGFEVNVVDTTGAGDTFNAAFAVFMHEGLPIAVKKACAAAALSVSRFGARGGMPELSEVYAFLAAQP